MTDKGCCTNPDCSGDVPKNMCIDVREALKSTCWPCPSGCVKFYKGYLTKETFKTCTKPTATKYDEIMSGFAVHFYYVVILLILSIIFRSMIIAEYSLALSPINTFDIILLITAVFSFMWVTTITKYPQAICCVRWMNSVIFTFVVGLMALVAFLNGIQNFQLMKYNSIFILNAFVYFLDALVLIPVCHYAAHTTYILKKEAETTEAKAASAKVAPA